MLFKWKLLSALPTVNKHATDYDAAKRAKRKKTVKKCFDKRARELPALRPAQAVFVRKDLHEQWQKGHIESRHSNRAYIVNGDSGGVYRRNRVHIQPTTIASHIPTADEFVANSLHTEEVDRETRPEAEDVPEVAPEAVSAPEAARPVRMRKKPTYLNDYDTA